MKANALNLILALLLTLQACLAQGQIDTTPSPDLSTLPVQSGGRLKPLDTLARESVRLVTGKVNFEKRDPVLTLLRWWAEAEKTKNAEIIEFRDLALKEKLGLVDKRWYSFEELTKSKTLQEWQSKIHTMLEAEEELNAEETKVQDLLIKMNVVHETMEGNIFRAVPNPAGLNEAWGSFFDLNHGKTVPEVEEAKASLDKFRQALLDSNAASLAPASSELRQSLAKLGPVPEPSVLAREVRYNKTHPFRVSWCLYLVGLAVLTFVGSGEKRGTGYWTGFSFILAGFLMHVYGFVLRCLIAGRPPVTNMYESVIWVAFGAVLFALIFEFTLSKSYYLVAASTGAVVCLVLADLLPTVLDPSIRPLAPVLRSNFWLTIHVLSITLGYAAFMLALGLGHIVLWKSALRPEQEATIASLHQALYRALQVGVLLLAAGTILGGVWANYSWGRFWGWDPKEVWALIALLGYLAILHGRYAGWLRKFGIAAWSVVAFQGVVMAWYGVNYVLGAGLHSYGFGTGGVKYMLVYVAIELSYVAWAVTIYKKRQKRTS